jgi:hypothetical protein
MIVRREGCGSIGDSEGRGGGRMSVWMPIRIKAYLSVYLYQSPCPTPCTSRTRMESQQMKGAAAHQ